MGALLYIILETQQEAKALASLEPFGDSPFLDIIFA